MKKKNLKSLKLNKKLISNVQPEVKGGKQQAFTTFCTTVLITRTCYTQIGQTCGLGGCFTTQPNSCSA
jgi:hypothetical protein